MRVSARYPGRIIPFAGIDPRRDNAAERLERWITEDGIRGLKLYPPCGWWPEDERAMRLYEVCHRHGVPVLFHTGDSLPLLDGDYSRPAYLLAVVKAFPDLEGLDRPCRRARRLGRGGRGRRGVQRREARAVGLAVGHVDARGRAAAGPAHRAGARPRGRGAHPLRHRPCFRLQGTAAGFLTKVTDMFLRLPQTASEAGIEISQAEMDLIMGLNAGSDLGLPGAVVTASIQDGGAE